MELWNTALSAGLVGILSIIGFQARAVLSNKARLDEIEGTKLDERMTQTESNQSALTERVSAIEAQKNRFDNIERELKALPERIAALEAHDIRKTTDQLHSRVNKLDISVGKLDGTVAKLDHTVQMVHEWLMSERNAK